MVSCRITTDTTGDKALEPDLLQMCVGLIVKPPACALFGVQQRNEDGSETVFFLFWYKTTNVC